jgi:hypothetical protein
MTKEEKFKILIDYLLESEERSYFEYCMNKASELFYFDAECLKKTNKYMSCIDEEEYLNSDDNKHVYAYIKLLQKHLNLN